MVRLAAGSPPVAIDPERTWKRQEILPEGWSQKVQINRDWLPLLSLKRKGLNLRRLGRRKSGLADDRYVLVVFFLLETRKGL
jgi:hypothetical protein